MTEAGAPAQAGSPSPVVKPPDPEVSPELAVADVAEVQTFVKSVSSGTDDAVEATAALTTACTTTDRPCVVPQQERARVKQPRKQAAPSGVSQDPAAAPLFLQEAKHVALGLHSFWVRRPRGGSDPWSCAVRGGDQSNGDGGYCALLSKHWRRERQRINPAAGRLRIRLPYRLT